ncbi:MAG: acetate kinase [Anaerolineae bacterium]|nr:acetate kinase [Phycisphaerae bacterium]
MNILVLNAGSSTLKYKLLSLRDAADESPRLIAADTFDCAESVASAAESAIRKCMPMGINAVGHRVVHGGPKFTAPVRITRNVVHAIQDVSALAPLHNDNALHGIIAGWQLLPNVPAVAVFDTAFHRTIPDVAALYAIPRELAEKHSLRRYGFHGISHKYVSMQLLKAMKRDAIGARLITCHLGNGASICAIRDGQSVDTSMGLTPMEGLVMGTRSGDVDPGLVLHLIRTLNMSPDEVNELLNHRSGLLGLSGRSSDVRELEQLARSGDQHADFALESFAYRVRKYIGAYMAALGGIDAIAFSGGIGERSPDMRARICRGLETLRIELDSQTNASASGKTLQRIDSRRGGIEVWVVPTDEETQIARELIGVL